MRTIKYVGFYDPLNSPENRVYSVAAVSKMNYVAQSLVNIGYRVELVSPSWINDTIGIKYFFKSRIIKVDKNIYCRQWFSFYTNIRVLRYLKIFLSLAWLFIFLIVHTKRGEKVIVYHSPWLAYPVLLAKKIRKFELILEVEEIYADVGSISKWFDKQEIRIIKLADKYILASDLLLTKVSSKKPHVILYGAYPKVRFDDIVINDGKVHVLYAGIIDTAKAGAFLAIEIARYLPENYMIHIIGFGEVELLIDKITDINSTSLCKIVYDGEIRGKDYIDYCSKCHIGLSTQRSTGQYVNTSFPSKIISYLSMGLEVVSCNIECVRVSKIGSLVNYYNGDDPYEVAHTILNLEIRDKYNKIKVIENLDKDFLINLSLLLNK
jgi:hypothetical protein